MIFKERFLITSQDSLDIYLEMTSASQDDAYIIAVDKDGNETRQKFEDSVNYKSGNHNFSMKCTDLYDLCNLLQRNNQSLSIEKILERADQFNKTIIFYHGKDKKLEQLWGVKCLLCGHEAIKRARHFKECSGCHYTNKVTDNEIFKKTASLKHNDRYLYSDDYVNTYTKIRILCKCGHIFYQRPNDHLKGNGCPKCQISSGELTIERWMIDHQIDYIWQHKFDDLKNIKHLILDFYCPSLNMIIEYDGEGHTELDFYIKRRVKDPEKKLQSIQFNDRLKNEYAEKNNIRMLRISYKDKKKIGEILSLNIYGDQSAK